MNCAVDLLRLYLIHAVLLTGRTLRSIQASAFIPGRTDTILVWPKVASFGHLEVHLIVVTIHFVMCCTPDNNGPRSHEMCCVHKEVVDSHDSGASP